MSRQLLKQSDQTFFIDERRGFDIFGPNGYFVYCIWGEACNGVLVRPGLHSSHFYVIDAHSMLEVGVGWQPGDDGRGARNIAGSHTGGSQGCIFAYNHGASCVLRSFPVDRDRPDADAMRLEKREQERERLKNSSDQSKSYHAYWMRNFVCFLTLLLLCQLPQWIERGVSQAARSSFQLVHKLFFITFFFVALFLTTAIQYT